MATMRALVGAMIFAGAVVGIAAGLRFLASVESTVAADYVIDEAHNRPVEFEQVPPINVYFSQPGVVADHVEHVEPQVAKGMSMQMDSLLEEDQYAIRYFASLDRDVRTGMRDQDWFPDIEIAKQIQIADPASRVIDTSCNADLCRVEIWHSEQTSKGEFFRKVGPILPSAPSHGLLLPQEESNVFSGGVVFNYENNNPSVTHMYISRPGRHFGGPAPTVSVLPPEVIQAIEEYRRQAPPEEEAAES
jgi:hypothetical protein